MADFDLSGYNTVPERIVEFREKYADGCLRPADPSQPWVLVEAGGTTFIAYTAAAYRSPTDTTPGIGCAVAASLEKLKVASAAPTAMIRPHERRCPSS